MYSKLTKLKGSTKQVNWAVSIRNTILGQMTGKYSEDIITSLSSISSASFWIDNRDKKVSTISKMIKPLKFSAKEREEAKQATEKAFVEANRRSSSTRSNKGKALLDYEIEAAEYVRDFKSTSSFKTL